MVKSSGFLYLDEVLVDFSNKLISVVSPAWNESASLPELVSRIKKVFERMNHSRFEILIVENGSTDQSLNILRKLNQEDDRVQYIKLSRNFGHQGALVAGLEQCLGDCAITIDADLQQPPELIEDMVNLWKEGKEIVYTVKDDGNRLGSIKKLGMTVFYRLISFVGHMKLNYGQSDFRLMDRKVIDVLKRTPEREKFLRGLVYWMGFEQTGLKYKVQERAKGASKFSLINLIKFAVNGIFAFSIFPLRIYLYTGFLVSSLCILYGFFIAALKVWSYYQPEVLQTVLLPRGWATVIYFITLLGGLQLIGIGLLGEYVGKILKQVKGRPVYIVSESSRGKKSFVSEPEKVKTLS